MKDFVTNAYTLRVAPSRDFDKTATLFTEDFGKIEVRVVSGRKPLSKFSPHLEPLRRVRIRLAKRSGFTLTDVLSDAPQEPLRNNHALQSAALKSIALVCALAPKEIRDDHVWQMLEKLHTTGVVEPKNILSLLGYDAHHAVCDGCGAHFVVGFNIHTHEFVCIDCAALYQESRIIIL